MDIKFTDFNGAKDSFERRHASLWDQVFRSLTSLPLHLKDSDQSGKQGSLIFDPVGTNFSIRESLTQENWVANVPVPKKFNFLGSGVDFVKNGVVVEVQFSNYPFLLNNAVRAELLFKSKENMAGAQIESLILITKGHMFPASNSTLYYEQGVNQLTELSRNDVLEIPIRLVGLFSAFGTVSAKYTGYHAPRYSRTVIDRSDRLVTIARGSGAQSRCRLSFE